MAGFMCFHDFMNKDQVIVPAAQFRACHLERLYSFALKFQANGGGISLN